MGVAESRDWREVWRCGNVSACGVVCDVSCPDRESVADVGTMKEMMVEISEGSWRKVVSGLRRG